MKVMPERDLCNHVTGSGTVGLPASSTATFILRTRSLPENGRTKYSASGERGGSRKKKLLQVQKKQKLRKKNRSLLLQIL